MILTTKEFGYNLYNICSVCVRFMDNLFYMKFCKLHLLLQLFLETYETQIRVEIWFSCCELMIPMRLFFLAYYLYIIMLFELLVPLTL